MRTRFAPSPTGHLHIGNAYSAWQCHQWREGNQAEFILRIEDIDHTRCRPEFSVQLIDDLQWLGLSWNGPVIYQSQRLPLYQRALDQLNQRQLIYPCFCTRKEIQAYHQNSMHIGLAPHADEAYEHYPGICKTIPITIAQQRMQNEAFAWRLDSQHAFDVLDPDLSWRDQSGNNHPVLTSQVGDVVLGRKDIGFSYHLAVVVDDADQQITHVIRGEDLLTSTPIHRVLQGLLQLNSPIYQHHTLLKDHSGQRLAKRLQSTTLKGLRESGLSAQAVRDFLNSENTIWDLASLTGNR